MHPAHTCTHLTHEPLDAIVRPPQMGIKCSLLSKCKPTNIAFEWLLSRVRPNVVLKVPALFEASKAHLTLVGAVFAVRSLMLPKVN